MQAGVDLPPVPKWFHSEVVCLFALYPSAVLSKATALAWWRHLHTLPEQALRAAFQRAPVESAQYCPSAELVRQIATAVAKTLTGPKADLERPALPEPAPELPPDNPWHATLERYKRGEIPGKTAVQEIVQGMADRIGET